MFWFKQVKKQNSVLASEILNFEFPVDVHYLDYVLRYFWSIIEKYLYSRWPLVHEVLGCDFSENDDNISLREKNTENNERYRDLLISILPYDNVLASLLWVKARN